MQHFRSFEILHYAGVTEPNRHISEEGDQKHTLLFASPADDLPSWVPDWRVQRRQLPMISMESDTLGERSGVSAFEVPIDPSCRKLKMTGKLLGIPIRPCGMPHLDRWEPEENPRYQHSIDPWCNNMFVNFLGELEPSWGRQYHISRSFTDWLKSVVSTGEDPTGLLLRFARTLIMDGMVKSDERPKCIVPREEILIYFLEYSRLHLVVDAVAVSQAFDTVIDDYESMEKAAAYGYLAEHTCRYRTIFIGDQDIIGLGSVGISPGDRICFSSGMKTPFVVHPKEEQLELRGECYLDEFMDRSYDELDEVERDIVLV